MAPPPSTPGTCLSWTRADASDTQAVDCAQAHLFEQAGAVLLADQTDLPDDGRWRQLVRERCDPVVKQYLNGRFDPDGRFRVGALKPSPAKWAQGDRELRCGLQSASRSGRAVPDRGQGRRAGPGGGARPGHLPGDRRPHDRRPRRLRAARTPWRRWGSSTWPRSSRDAFPAVDEQDEFLQPECTQDRQRVRGRRRRHRRQEAHRLLGQPHRGLLEGGHPQGELQPGGAAARPQRIRARDRHGPRPGGGRRRRPPRPRRAPGPASRAGPPAAADAAPTRRRRSPARARRRRRAAAPPADAPASTDRRRRPRPVRTAEPPDPTLPEPLSPHRPGVARRRRP